MNLHKYVVDGKKVYVLSDKVSKPSGTLTLRQKDWEGRALGRFNTVVEQISNLKFTKETPEEVPEAAPEKGKSRKASVSEVIRKFSGIITKE
jgi:hypothetical protein